MNKEHVTETKTEKPKAGKRDGEAFKKEKPMLEGTMIDQWIAEHYGSEEILGREGLLAKLTKAVVERALGAEGAGYFHRGVLVVESSVPASAHVNATGTGDVLSVCMMLLHHQTDIPVQSKLKLANTIVSEFIEGRRRLIPMICW